MAGRRISAQRRRTGAIVFLPRQKSESSPTFLRWEARPPPRGYCWARRGLASGSQWGGFRSRDTSLSDTGESEREAKGDGSQTGNGLETGKIYDDEQNLGAVRISSGPAPPDLSSARNAREKGGRSAGVLHGPLNGLLSSLDTRPATTKNRLSPPVNWTALKEQSVGSPL